MSVCCSAELLGLGAQVGRSNYVSNCSDDAESLSGSASWMLRPVCCEIFISAHPLAAREPWMGSVGGLSLPSVAIYGEKKEITLRSCSSHFGGRATGAGPAWVCSKLCPISRLPRQADSVASSSSGSSWLRKKSSPSVVAYPLMYLSVCFL